jgi:hypothetical protein
MIPILTTLSTIQCPHGGSLILTTANTLCQIDGGYALLQTDVHSVAGCPFQKPPPSGTGLVPSPCLTVRWTSGATQNTVNKVPVLLQTSSGICYSAEQLPQGAPVVTQAQSKAKGQ